MASLSNRVSNCFPINSSLKWWLFQCFFGPFTVSPSQNLKKKKKKKKKKTGPTRGLYFSGWVRFLPIKPDCYRVELQVAVKPTRHDPISALAGSMGLKIEGSKGKYLGLPMLIGKSKKGTFQEVVERVEKKYQG